MRIKNHPILNFEKELTNVNFEFDGKTYSGIKGQPIVCALHDAGVLVLGHSHKGRTRGLYCAIGNCSSCLATVNGISNVRLCTEMLDEGMIIHKQQGKKVLRDVD